MLRRHAGSPLSGEPRAEGRVAPRPVAPGPLSADVATYHNAPEADILGDATTGIVSLKSGVPGRWKRRCARLRDDATVAGPAEIDQLVSSTEGGPSAS